MYYLLFLEVRSLTWFNRDASLLEAPEENLSLPFLASRGYVLWFGLLLASTSVVTSPSLTGIPPSSTFSGICDYIGPTNVIHDNLPISRSLINHAYKIAM